MKEKCDLCGCNYSELNFHHLIPKTLHSSKKFRKLYEKEYMKTNGIWICKSDCHHQIHRFISEKNMGLYYYTLELLKEQEDVKKYLEWRIKRL